MKQWLAASIRLAVTGGIGLLWILLTLGVFAIAGIPISFQLSSNSPEVAYISAGIMGGVATSKMAHVLIKKEKSK